MQWLITTKLPVEYQFVSLWWILETFKTDIFFIINHIVTQTKGNIIKLNKRIIEFYRDDYMKWEDYLTDVSTSHVIQPKSIVKR